MPSTARPLTVLIVPIVLASVVSLPARDGEVGAILRRRCVGCHGEQKKKAKLRLDSLEAVLAGGSEGPAIVVGRSQESSLIRRITSEDPDERMPPEGKGDTLSDHEIEVLRKWIDSGAGPEAFARVAPEVFELARGSLPVALKSVFAVAGDPTASRVAVGRGDRVEIYSIPDQPPREAEKGEPVVTLEMTIQAHRDLVQALAFSRDGKYLASGEYRTVRVWETGTWKEIAVLSSHVDRVLAVAFDPEGKRLASGGGLPTESGEIKLWEIATGEEIWSATPHTDTVLGLDFSADGKTLATGGADRVTYLLRAESGEVEKRIEGHTHHVLAVAFSPDGKQLATAGADAQLRLWNLETGGVERTTGKHEGDATAVCYQRDGQQIATVSGDGELRFWDPRNSRERRSYREAKGYLQSGSFFAKDTRYVTAEQTGTVRVYDLERNRLLFTIEPPKRLLRRF